MKLPRGSEEHFCDAESGITAAHWYNNSIVTIASSEYGVSPVVKAERYIASKKKHTNVLMPNAVHQYNQKMGGVDRLVKILHSTGLQFMRKVVLSNHHLPDYIMSKQCLDFCKRRRLQRRSVVIHTCCCC